MGSGGSDNPVYTKKNYDSSMIQQFAQSTASSKFTAAQVDQLHTAYGGQQGPNGLGDWDGHDQPIDENLIGAFTAFQAAQVNQDSLWNKYASLAQQQQGRDQTILTGPQALKPSTILGGMSK